MSNIRKTIISALLFMAMTVLLVAVLPANAKASRPGYYTISYSTNGISGVTVPASFEVRDGALYGLSSQIPTRPGNYEFVGYDTSPAAKTCVYSAGQGNMRASSNLTLYPVWQKRSTTTTTTTKITTYNYATHLDAPIAAATQTNKPCKIQRYYDKDQKTFNFGGWCIHDQGINRYRVQLSGSGFTSDKVKNFSWTTRGDVASHTPDVRPSIGVNKNAPFTNCGYSGTVDMSKLGNGDYKLTVYGIPNAGAEFSVCEISFNIRPAGTIYVIFDANGGKGTANKKQLITVGGKTKLTPPNFTKDGYTLMGFSTNKNAKTVGFELNKAYTFNGVSNNTRLYAVWGYKVVIDANGGTFHDGTTRYERSYPVGTTVTIDFHNPPYDQFLIWLKGNGLGKAMEKPGCSFANNYSTNPNATPGSSSNSLKFTVNSNITLYPVWVSTVRKGGIWYNKNVRNNNYADVMMYVDKANANKFADELQKFVIENGAKRKKIEDKERAIAKILRELSPFTPINFVYDCWAYGVDVALDNLAEEFALDRTGKFTTLTNYVKKGFDHYGVAYALYENTAATINVGDDKTFKRNFDILENVYKQLRSQGVYSGKHGKANADGGIFIQINKEASALFISGTAASVLSKYGLPVIENTGIDYNALLRDNGGNWVDEEDLRKADPNYNKQNDTLFTALYKVLSLTDGDQKISGPRVI